LLSLSASLFRRCRGGRRAPTSTTGVLFAVINFAIVLAAVFLLQQVNRLFPKPAGPAAPAMKECAWCASSIPAAAKRCPHCTSNLSGA
jgi:hypothetical protein